MTPSISVVVLSYNRADDLRANLESLLGATVPQLLEVIVVDNASTDGSPEMLASLARRDERLTVIANERNLGVAAGRNAGYSAARGEYVVTLDDDSSIPAGDLARVPEWFSSHPEAGILAFRVVHARTRRPENDHGIECRPVANFHGAGHAFRAEVFERVGLLDEICSFGGEEIDMSIRAFDAGYPTVYEPGMMVEHNSLVREGGDSRRRRSLWLYNYVRVLYKHFPPHLARRFSRRIIASLVVSGVARHGLPFAPVLLESATRGRRDGMDEHRPVGEATCRFYSDPRLRPDFGNVSLRAKLAARLGLAQAGSL